MHFCERRSLISLFLLLSLALPLSAQSVPKFLYVVNYVDDTISAFRIQPLTGQPTEVAGSPFPGVPAMQGIALTPDHRFLYAAGFGIEAYSVNAQTGSLTEIGFYAMPTNSGRAYITTDGKYLYAATDGIYAWAIDSSNGTLTPVPGSPFNSSTSYAGVSATPDSAYLYAPALLQAGGVEVFSIQPDGELVSIATYPISNSPIDIVVEPSGRFVYVANYGGGISGYGINATDGTLTNLPGSPYSTGGSASNAITASANGRAIIVDNQGQNTTASLAIQSDGSLVLAGTPQPSPDQPGGVVVDPTSEFVYTSATNGNAMAAYRLDPVSLALEIVPGAQWPTGTDPYAMAILAVPVAPYCPLSQTEPSVTLCAPGSTTVSPVRIVAGTTSSTAVKQMQVFVDGVQTYSSAGSIAIDVPVSISAGAHKLTVKAQNQAGQSFALSRNISVTGSGSSACSNYGIFPTVAVCSPLAGSTTGTSIHVVAKSYDYGTVSTTTISVDGSQVYSVAGGQVDTTITISQGPHNIAVQSVDSAGATWSSTVRITAQ